MPIQFSQNYGAQPQGGVVTALRPDYNMTSPGNDIGNQILAGMQAGAQIQESRARTGLINQQNASLQQQTSQNQTIFEQQQQMFKQGQADAASIRAAAGHGLNAAIQAHMQVGDVAGALDLQKSVASLQKTYMDLNKSTEDLKGKQLGNGTSLSIDAAHHADLIYNATQPDPNNPQNRVPLPPDQKQAAWSQYLQMIGPENAQTLIKGGAGQLTPTTYIALHTNGMAGLATIADKTQAQHTGSAKKSPFGAALDAENQAKQHLQDVQQSGSPQDIADAQRQYQLAQQNTAGSVSQSASKPIPTLLTGAQGQKDFFGLRALDRNLSQSLTTLNTLGKQMDSIPKDAFNPVTGEMNAKFTAQGEAITKNLKTLVLQAPSLFGMSGSALRLGSVWNMIEQSKPSPGMWMAANKAMIEDLKYNAAIQAHKSWKDEAEQMQAQAMSGNPQAVAESQAWAKNHPDPLTMIQKPDLTNFYKLFPKARELNMEADWGSVAAAPLKSGDQSTPQNQSQVQMPSFNSKEEFTSWYQQQSPEVQQQVRSQLK